uniref:EF-hand domain-containing protein n=1 Tax=Eutreptiella gymnastica TaxID=73025 RepID=A0A7S4CRQ1_9EUGL
MDEFDVLVEEVGAYFSELVQKSGGRWQVQDMANSFISAAVKNEKREIFERMDQNKDGVLSLSELKDYVYFLIDSAGTSTGPKRESVYDRLCDEGQYTGMYANRKETAIDKTDPSVEKHATGHAKNFNEAPVQKFGVQADKPVQFRCWNGLDKHAQAQKVTVSNVRTFEQLVTKCTNACNVSPQPTWLHTPAGKAVKSLEAIKEGENYIVIQSGGIYKPERLPTALVEQIKKPAPGRPMSASQQQMNHLDDNLFDTAQKPSSLRRSSDSGRRGSGPGLPTPDVGSGRRSSDRRGSGHSPDPGSGRRSSGGNASGGRRGSGVYDRLTDASAYTGMYANRNEEAIRIDDPSVEKKGTGHAKNFDSAPVQKFGLQTDKPTQFICWNGLDKHATGQKIVMSNVRTMEQLVTKCTQACNVSPQPMYLHTPSGKPVKTLEQIHEGQHYIVIQSGAKYARERLPTALPK